jgi:hypothetical protein
VLADNKFCQDFTGSTNFVRFGTPVFSVVSGISFGGLWLALKDEAPQAPILLAGAGTASVLTSGLLLFRPICGRGGDDPFSGQPLFPARRTASIVGLGVASAASFSAAYVINKKSKTEKKASLGVSPAIGGSTMSFSLSW